MTNGVKASRKGRGKSHASNSWQSNSGASWVRNFEKSIDARNFGYNFSVRTPVQTVGVEVRGKTASGDGIVRAIFLGRKSRGSVAFSNPSFSGGKSY